MWLIVGLPPAVRLAGGSKINVDLIAIIQHAILLDLSTNKSISKAPVNRSSFASLCVAHMYYTYYDAFDDAFDGCFDAFDEDFCIRLYILQNNNMPYRLPDNVKTPVIQQWLAGHTRDKIANDCGISTGAVSNMVNEWKMALDTYRH